MLKQVIIMFTLQVELILIVHHILLMLDQMELGVMSTSLVQVVIQLKQPCLYQENGVWVKEVIKFRGFVNPNFTYTVFGDQGDDIISGGNGNDQLTSGKGDDQLSGGDGSDTLTGGERFDLFAYTQLADVNTPDIISYK